MNGDVGQWLTNSEWKVGLDKLCGELTMTANRAADQPAAGWKMENAGHLNFEALAALRKWPSVRGERIPNSGASSYTVFEGTLDECIQRLNEKTASVRGLYEIHTEPQGPTLAGVLSADDVQELIRLREFL
jgi:hypothetical protein